MIKALSAMVLLLSLGILAGGCSGTRPLNLGVHDSKFAPCPVTHNCVSNQSSGKYHAVMPLRFSGTPAEAMADLKKVLSGMPRASIVTETDVYLRLEFRSALFRFVDDVEFWVDEKARVIHVRSASRIGTNDLGVNRRRIENIRAALNALSETQK